MIEDDLSISEPLTTRDKQRAKALADIGVKDGDYLTVPQLTPIWKQANGGIAAVISALRSSNAPEARAFLNVYDTITKRAREVLFVEEIALAAKIPDLLAFRTIAIAAVCIDTEDAAKLMLASSRPELIAASLAQAVTKKGFADRELLLKASGTMPTPRGATVLINNAPQIAQSPDTPRYFSPEERLRALHGESPALPAPIVELPVVDADFTDVPVEIEIEAN